MMECKHFRKAICLVCAGISPFLGMSCRSGAKPSETEIVKIAVVPLPGDTAFLGYAAQISVVDTMMYLQDNRGGETFLRAYAYPSLKPLCKFVTRGKGPEEMLAVSGYTADKDSVRVFAAQEHEMAVYAVSDLCRGINRPVRVIEYPQSCMPALAFCGVKGGFALQNSSSAYRLTLIDSSGHIQAEKYDIPVSETERKKVQPELIPYLWQSVLASDGAVVAVGTKLGDVLEIYDLEDSLRNRVVRGEGGEPAVSHKGRGMQMGTISGFYALDIADGKVYALFDGSRLADYNGQDAVPRKIFLRVYDLSTGELERIYELDRHISSFDILTDGKTVIATDPNAEHQLCTFTLPD